MLRTSPLNATARCILDTLVRAHVSEYGPQSCRHIEDLFRREGTTSGWVEARLNELGNLLAPTRRRGYPDVRTDMCELVRDRLEEVANHLPPAVWERFLELLPEAVWG